MNLYQSKYTAEQFETAMKAVLDPYNEGVKSEYDRFWDIYQINGNRSNYVGGFCGHGWNNLTFKPKYDIIVQSGGSAQFMFNACRLSGSLPELLNAAGVRMELRDIASADAMFHNATDITEIGELNISNTTVAGNLCCYTLSLTRIEKLIINDFGTTDFGNNAFLENRNLVDITFEGVIGLSINFQWSTKLSVASMKSIIMHLKDYSDTTNESVYSIKFADECWAKLDAEGGVSPNGNQWSEYVIDLGWSK